MINKQEQEKVLRRSTYHKESTERLLDLKSQELGNEPATDSVASGLEN